MNKILVLIGVGALNILSSYAQQKVDTPTFLFSSHSSLTVNSVEHAEAATVLCMHYQGSAYGTMSMSSATRLVDEHGQAYPIKAVKEFALDSTIILPQSGTMDFTLLFSPLPKDTRIFDLIEGYQSNAWRIYGITDGKNKVTIPVRTEAIDPKEVTEASLQPDSVCILGHISGYDRRTMPRFICSDYHADQLDFTDSSKYPICCRIDSLGNFALSFLADHAVWDFLELIDANRLLPFLVHPGDTLLIDIDNYGQWNEQVNYTSRQGHEVCSGLMHLGRDLIEQYYPGTANEKSLETFMNEDENFYTGKSCFYDYIVWKYHLTPWEAHLLSGNLMLNKTINRLHFINEMHNQRIAAWFKLPKDNRQDYESIRYIKTEEEGILKELSWNDPSLAFHFYWSPLIDEYYVDSPMDKFVYDTEAGWTNPNNDWDAAHQEKYRHQLQKEFPGLAANLIEDIVRNKAPWTKHIIKDHSEMTYTSDSPAVQQFIASMLPGSKSQLLQLLFIDRKNALNMNKWYNARHNVIEDFSQNPQLSFVIVMEKDTETEKVEQVLRYRFPNTHIGFVPTETFLDLCEGFRIISFPEDITINNKGEILKAPLKSYDESTFRQRLKRLQKILDSKIQ